MVFNVVDAWRISCLGLVVELLHLFVGLYRLAVCHRLVWERAWLDKRLLHLLKPWVFGRKLRLVQRRLLRCFGACHTFF